MNNSIPIDKPVLYVTRLLPGYRKPVLRLLNERLDGRLIVCHGQPPRGSSFDTLMDSEPSSYMELPLRNYWALGDSVHFQPYGPIFRRTRHPAALIAEESARSISLPFLLSRAERLGVPRLLWGHFSSNNRIVDPSSSWRDRYRIRMAQSVEACICYTKGIRDELRPYVSEEKLFVARNTVDIESLLAQRTRQSPADRLVTRSELGISPDVPLITYLGRLIRAKRPDLIIDTFVELRSRRPAKLLIIGEGPARASMEAAIPERLRGDVHFAGAVVDPVAFGPLLGASDAALNPGRLGLSVNHCFATGLPIVSVKSPDGTRYHSPEGEYVVDGETGRLVDRLTANALADGICDILGDRQRYSDNAYRYASERLKTEHMIGGILAALDYATSGSSGRSV